MLSQNEITPQTTGGKGTILVIINKIVIIIGETQKKVSLI